MRKRYGPVLLATLALGLLSAASWALNIQPLQAEGEDLVVQARKRYAEGLVELDRQQFKQALICFVEASQAVRKELNPEALKAYEEGSGNLDCIRYEAAIENFIAAANLEPERRDVRFVIGELAAMQAGKHSGAESVALLEKARTAYSEILKAKSVKRFEEQRAQARLEQIEAAIASQAERDALRAEIAEQIVKEESLRRERLAKQRALDNAKQKKEDKEDSKNSRREGSASRSSEG